jgi:peptidoglycan L-alanyl-D-glutamate endopeptidase CwlK
MMSYALGARSRAKLVGVHPRLVAVVERAIQLTTQDFAVTDGLRTLAQQQQLVARGASKTLKSKHLKQADGFGHAVDLVPFIGGAPRWEWPPIWAVAQAVDQAATELGVRLVWGAIWDRTLLDYGGSPAALQAAVEAYKVRHAGSDFLDGPHYQLAA